jgi:hypothetical protein
LAEHLGATPQKGRDAAGNETWGAASASGNWGFLATRWRYGNDGPRYRATVAMAILDPNDNEGNGKVDRQSLRDTNPSAVLTWAARLGLLGSIEVSFANGTRFRTGELWRKRGVRL